MRVLSISIEGRRIRVRGLVQGVGFRPHVWRLANAAGLAGQVRNDGEGVEIEVWGGADALERFVRDVGRQIPPLARIDAIETERLTGAAAREPFKIGVSGRGDIATGIVPDAATCPACLGEMLDPADRRHRYAFINCTHCGPRLSIVREIPYDRATTSMSVFAMCAACQAEYDNPADRRFHAQPNACPACGPKVWLENHDGVLDRRDPVGEAALLLAGGAIVAVKGIGGFHLACDAMNDAAVKELRARKRRDHKPLAVMARDLAMARRFANVREDEATLLAAAAAPIVLLKAQGQRLSHGVAPGQDRIGVMLPYTPLHHLLMRDLDTPIVLTSGNLSDEPQVTTNEDARTRLAGIADYWLMHDRAIVNRLDDSVMRCDAPGPSVLRRARGLAPAPLRLAAAFGDVPPVLAMGGELKATFCLLQRGQAILSQHIGDLEEAATHADYRAMLALYRNLYGFAPHIIAVDRHPDYLSTQWGTEMARQSGARLVQVQHHHAHLAACLAEHRVAPGEDGSLGIILDGLGLGDDATIWGGEFLAGGYGGFERVGHFRPVAMPGGAQAAREPWRNLYAHLRAAFGASALGQVGNQQLAAFLAEKPLATLDRMMERNLNAPLASSAGRLFDAVAAAIGVRRERQAYEGQAAMELETCARPYMADATPYPVGIVSGALLQPPPPDVDVGRNALGADGSARTDSPLVLVWDSMWRAMLDDLARGLAPGRIAARFHLGLCASVANAAISIARARGLRRMVLSGGVMQNRLLLEGLHARLTGAGFQVLTHRAAPANDGGLALGQAVIAALR